LCDMGKIETSGGRRPSTFGLMSDAGYFLGIDITDNKLHFGVIDMNKNRHAIKKDIPFVLTDKQECLDALSNQIDKFIQESGVDRCDYLGIGIIIRGRVDSTTGHSYNIFNFDSKRPLAQIMTEKTGIPTIIENDTRAMAYAEYENCNTGSKDALFINIGRGVGVGIIIGGKLYYGKSGFSGEFGHIPFFDNQKICHCGKKGCLETEASGAALENAFVQSLKEGASSILSEKYAREKTISYHDIVEAAGHDDVLSIELITSIGEKLGRGVGVLINLFNPELVVVGGGLSRVGDYLMLPIRTALNKYSLSLVNRDSTLRLSTLGDSAGVLGAALLTRYHILELS
ncbi:MAG: ROK family protein, partial [Mucinivorans sp.]